MMLKLKPLIAAKARESYKSNVGRTSKSPHNSATISKVETRDELSKLAAKAKENRATHTKNGYKQLCQNSDNPVDTKKELSKLAGVSQQ